MSRQRTLWIVLLVITCLAWAGPASAEKPAPVQLAGKCIQAMTKMANNGIDRNRTIVEKALPAIDALLAAGEFEKAEVVAGKSIGLVRKSSRTCVNHINGCCKKCVDLLQAAEKPELVEKVRAARAEQVDRVKQSCDRAVAAIEKALPPMP